MNAEFQWWLLILGIVIGGALVYLVLADVQGDEPFEEPLDEPSDQPSDQTVPAGAADPSSDTSADPRSARNVADVEGHRPETEPAEAHPDEAGPSHRRGERAGVGEPLERSR